MASWAVNIASVPLLGEEIAQQRVAVLGEDGFGVELDALHRQGAMAHAHDFAVLGPGRHLELGRATRPLDRERMVARGVVRRGQPGEDALAAMVYARDLAVHERVRVHHLATEGLADRLVSEAHPEDRDAPGESIDGREGNAGL